MTDDAPRAAKCPDCYGTKTNRCGCTVTDRKALKNCPTCKGTGWHICFRCYGTGCILRGIQ